MSSKPDMNRMRTREGNSKAHPGRALDVLRTHRPREAIQRGKEEKKAKQDAKEEKKRADEGRKKAGKEHISQLEIQVATEASNDRSEFPRQHAATKRRANSLDEKSSTVDFRDMVRGKKPKKKLRVTEQVGDELADSEQVDHTSKRAKSNALRRTETQLTDLLIEQRNRDMSEVGKNQPLRRTETQLEDLLIEQGNQGRDMGKIIKNQPLRRTETQLEDLLIEQCSQGRDMGEVRKNQPLRRTETQLEDLLIKERNHGCDMGNVVMASSPSVMDAMDVDLEDEVTPHPVKRAGVDLGQETEVEDGSDSDEPFRTPLLGLNQRNKYLTAKIWNSGDSADEETEEEQEEKLNKHKPVQVDDNVRQSTTAIPRKDLDRSRFSVGPANLNPTGFQAASVKIKDKSSRAQVQSTAAQPSLDASRRGSQVMLAKTKDGNSRSQSAVPMSSDAIHRGPQAASAKTPYHSQTPSLAAPTSSDAVGRGSQATSIKVKGISSRSGALSSATHANLDATDRGSQASKLTSKGKPTNFTMAAMRTTSSNSNVVSKPVQNARLPGLKSKSAKNPEAASGPEATSGMQSGEDDALEREVAMLSPMKGEEYRNSVQTLVKSKEVNRKQKPAVDRLPAGATSDDAWSRVVVPNFINLVLSGDKPWMSGEADIAPLLQEVWDRTYGSKIPFKIQKGTVPFDLAYQKLCQYRNGFAAKAISVIYNYIVQLMTDDDIEIEVLAEFAEQLLENNNFIYKGMENPNKPKRTGTFQHALVVQTFSAHFSKLTVTVSPLKGISIGKPYCGLALTIAALERALHLYSKQMITTQDGKFVISKGLNPDTNKESRSMTDFSFTVWGEVTDDYLISIKKLDKRRFEQIYDAAFNMTRYSGKYKPNSKLATSGEGRSNRADLHSDSDSDADGPVRLDGNGNSHNGDKEADQTDGSNSDIGPIDHGYNDW